MKKNFKIWMLILSIGLLIGIIFGSSIYADGDMMTFHHNLIKGQSFNAVETMDLHIKYTNDHKNYTIENGLGFGYLYKIDKVAKNGDITVQLVINSVFVKSPGFMGQSDFYDSTDPFMLPTQSTIPYAFLIGKAIKVITNNNGDIKEIQLPDQYFDEISSTLSKNNKENKKELKEKLQKQLIDSVLQHQNEDIGDGILFEKPIRVGDSWTKQFEKTQNELSFVVDVNYIFKEHHDGIAVIEFNSKSLSVKNLSGNSKDYKLIDIVGGMEGSIEVDEASGWILRSTIQIKVKGKIQGNQSDSDKEQDFCLEGNYTKKPFNE